MGTFHGSRFFYIYLRCVSAVNILFVRTSKFVLYSWIFTIIDVTHSELYKVIAWPLGRIYLRQHICLTLVQVKACHAFGALPKFTVQWLPVRSRSLIRWNSIQNNNTFHQFKCLFDQMWSLARRYSSWGLNEYELFNTRIPTASVSTYIQYYNSVVFALFAKLPPGIGYQQRRHKQTIFFRNDGTGTQK